MAVTASWSRSGRDEPASPFDQVLRVASDTTIYLLRLMVFLGVPIGIYVVSRILRVRWQRRPSPTGRGVPSFTDTMSLRPLRRQWATIAVIVVGGLG